MWGRTLPPFDAGVPGLDIHADNLANVWLVVDSATIVGFDGGTGKTLAASLGPLDGGDATTVTPASGGGLVAVEPLSGTVRSFAPDGSELYSGVRISRIVPGSLTHAHGDLTLVFEWPSVLGDETTCTGTPAATDMLDRWLFSPPVGGIAGHWPIAATWCLTDGLTEPALAPGIPCPADLEPVALRLSRSTAGGMVRIDPVGGGPIVALSDPDGGAYLARGDLDSITEILRLPESHYASDIAVSSVGAVVAVGTRFPPATPRPDDPFNAQVFIICEPFGAPGAHSSSPVDHPFVDVSQSWQQEPVTWAWITGVTFGVDPAHFAPERSITRGEIAAMLYRDAGEPAVFGTHPFSYVVLPWQEDAIRWLHVNGYTAGVDATHFAPDREITRAEWVPFLHRRWLND